MALCAISATAAPVPANPPSAATADIGSKPQTGGVPLPDVLQFKVGDEYPIYGRLFLDRSLLWVYKSYGTFVEFSRRKDTPIPSDPDDLFTKLQHKRALKAAEGRGG
ncbi:hypothetical protein PspLS_08249 [Pyricularia sp. CBS 133598]|nr:hypothetical protein PspLS_08249 [Pyricularia sp. CBS 133598]